MTDPAGLYPYYFPTTAVFVDDNPDFLDSLALELPADLAFETYADPRRALDRINEPRVRPPLYQRCFTRMQTQSDAGIASQQVIRLDLSLIEREISVADRFRQVSVVVVDYDMPGMDGLEFCRSVADPQLRKVLFTGVADEKIAVQAFNAGIIDRFIIKNHAEAADEVRRAVAELQGAYFRSISEILRATLMLDPPPFMRDPAVAELCDMLRRRHGFVEYYLVAEPDGFLMLTADGTLHRLVILPDDAIAEQAAQARRWQAPAQIVADLEARRRLGYFYERVEECFDPAEYPWDEYLFPAHAIDGRRTWHWALIEAPPVDIDFDEGSANYLAYLERLDAERHGS